MASKNIFERYLWFDEQVRAGRYPNATKLAERFEVSIKTAQRDLDYMRDRLNCPLEYDDKIKGYRYSDETFSLPYFNLSAEELSSLLVARALLKNVSRGLIRKEVGSVIDRIMQILRKNLEQSDRIDEAVSFQVIEYSPVSDEVFGTVLDGCMRRHCIRFRYYSPAKDEHTTRTVEPYHLFNYMGAWHLVAYCYERKDYRDFVLGRMSGLSVLDKKFTIPKDFDLNDHLQSGFGIFKGKSRQEVTLRFTPKTSRWIREQIWHRNQSARLCKDGSLEITFPVADFQEIKMEILKHGPGVEVLKPKELRQIVRDEARAVQKIYSKR